MAPPSKTVAKLASENSVATTSNSPYQLDPKQTLRATKALTRKIQSDQAAPTSVAADKANLLADADAEDVEDQVPVWLILTTKKHIIDKKRLKPGKISLPHPYLDWKGEKELRICLITADPQRQYKDLTASPAFNPELSKRITRVIGVTKLKTKYKSYESRRQLLSEYDVFLADDRIITYLPGVLGKVFYKSSSKRPVPVSLEGKKESLDEQGNKRRKLSEGGTKAVKNAPKPEDIAREIERTLSTALVHLAPSTNTAVKVGLASQTPEQIQENVEAVSADLIEKFVPQKWRNVRALHIKGPNTAALPIWLANELWEDEADVLDKATAAAEGGKKRKRSALLEGSTNGKPAVIEVPGPDGKMRRLEAPASKQTNGDNVVQIKKRRKSDEAAEAAGRTQEKAEKDARKADFKTQKAQAKLGFSKSAAGGKGKTRAKAADLI